MNTVARIIDKIDSTDEWKNKAITKIQNKADTKVEKYRVKLFAEARKVYTTEYMTQLIAAVKSCDNEDDINEVEELSKKVNKEEYTEDIIRRISNQSKTYGKDILVEGNRSFWDDFFDEDER